LDFDLATVNNGGNTACAAELAGSALTEIGAWSSVNLNFRHVSFFLVVDNGVTDSVNVNLARPRLMVCLG